MGYPAPEFPRGQNRHYVALNREFDDRENKAKFDFGIAMLPASKRSGTPTGGGNFYIFKQTSAQDRKAAMRLIKFMTSPERSAEWSMKTGYMGISQAAYETPKLKQYINWCFAPWLLMPLRATGSSAVISPLPWFSSN